MTSANTMQAVVLHGYGGPEVLSFETVPRPRAGDGEVLLRVEAVSINRGFDIVARNGGSPFALTLPLILGVDPTGRIVETGAGVDVARIGELASVSALARCGKCDACRAGRPCTMGKRIGVTLPGGYAQYVSVPAFQARTLPTQLDPGEATMICRHAGVAYTEIETVGLVAGETALVMGAAGALGMFIIQLAKLRGATVIAVASSDERLDSCIALGADFVVNYREGDLTEQVMAHTNGRGVDVVFENISDPEMFPKAFASLAIGGRLITIGYHGGGVVPVDMKLLFMRRLKIMSSPMWAAGRDDLQTCLDLAAEGKLRAPIGLRLPLSEAREGHRLVESGAVIGKVLLEPQR